jgi:hypothetical protein
MHCVASISTDTADKKRYTIRKMNGLECFWTSQLICQDDDRAGVTCSCDAHSSIMYVGELPVETGQQDR